MNKYMNTKGLTLVEVLAVLVLLSLVFLLIISTQLFGQREFSTQTERISNEENLQDLIKDMTREVRKINDNANIQVNEQNSVLTIGNISYSLNNSRLMKNNTLMAEDIESFNVGFNDAKDTLHIEIKSDGSQRTVEDIKTSIFLREGDAE